MDVNMTRLSEEQLGRFLRPAEAGIPAKEVCRSYGFSGAAFHGWRAESGGMEASEAARQRGLKAA